MWLQVITFLHKKKAATKEMFSLQMFSFPYEAEIDNSLYF